MNFRQPLSKFKNQILTAQKRDQFHSELDLIKDTIGNDSTRTVQANHDTIVFSCGYTGVGFVPLNQPGKFGFQHLKLNCGHVSDIHISPFFGERLVAVSSIDQSVRILQIPTFEREDEEIEAPLHQFRASAGSANTPVIICWNPQVSGILAVGSGTKVDIFSTVSNELVLTIDSASPIITLDWTHDGSKIIAISKDSTLRIINPRQKEILVTNKVTGTKHVIKSLPKDRFVISFLSRTREREMNLYELSQPSDVIKSWSFGTASTPLIPILDTVRKIIYLLDKSGGVMRWIEGVSPYNEGAAGTSVDQSSNACLIHPFGLQIMEGEINRLLIADTKGNTIPVKVTIGRKSYLEFHDDLFTPIEIESSITAEAWLQGEDRAAKVVKINPAAVKAVQKNESLSAFIINPQPVNGSDTRTSEANIGTTKKNIPLSATKEAAPQEQQKEKSKKKESTRASSTLSARGQRKWDKEEAAGKKSTSGDVSASAKMELQSEAEIEDKQALRNEEQEPSSSEQVPVGSSIGLGAPPLDDEDALEKLRVRCVTPAIEKAEENRSSESPLDQLQREVFREDLSARRAEYGATSPSKLRDVYKVNLGERRAEYGANGSSSRSDLRSESADSRGNGEPASRRAECKPILSCVLVDNYQITDGAPSKLKVEPSPASKFPSSVLSAREQRLWDKEVAKSSSPTSTSASEREVYREDLTARRAEYGASPKPTKLSDRSRNLTAEREAFTQDVAARRAESAATPKLSEPTQAYKELTKALGKPEHSSTTKAPVELEPYKADDDNLESDATKEELEDAYAPPIEDSTIAEKKPDKPIVEPSALVSKSPASVPAPVMSNEVQREVEDEPDVKSSFAKRTALPKSATFPLSQKDYTRKYLEGKPQHPRNSYTTIVGLNSSLPNTARMVDATPAHIIVPLAGPGGRLGIIPYERSGRQPPLITGFTGGAQVVDFETDKVISGRVVSAHADQSVKIWTVPDNLDDLETDIDEPVNTLTGMDRILSIRFHPSGVKDLLLVTTATKLHLFDVSTAKEVAVYPVKGLISATWSLDGNQIAVGKSDKSIAILDARSGVEKISFPSVHQSSRLFRLQFVADERIISAGFGRGSTRQLALYDTTTGVDLQVHDMDISPSPFSLPYYDEMSSILYLVPRGTSTILPFHIEQSSFTPLLPYNAPDPIMGTSFFAPQDLDISKVEVARCLRITTNEITVVGFHIPRSDGEYFHDDIYPEHVRDVYSPSLTVPEWLSGKESSEISVVPLNTKGLKPSSSNTGSVGRKGGVASSFNTPSRSNRPEVNKQSGLDEMFKKVKAQDGDEPENQNNAANTKWD